MHGNHKSIEGKDGQMFIFRRGVLFATVRNFKAHIVEVEEIMQGKTPIFDFQGIMRRKDGFGQKMVFRDCMVNSAVNISQLLSGALDEMTLRVNVVPDEFEKLISQA